MAAAPSMSVLMLMAVVLICYSSSPSYYATGKRLAAERTVEVYPLRDGTSETGLKVAEQTVEVYPNSEEISSTSLGDEYCCLRNMGCAQYCDRNKKYRCCLENGIGSCLQMCEEGIDYSCCLDNPFSGCLKMCDSSKQYYCCKKNYFGGCIDVCPKTITINTQ